MSHFLGQTHHHSFDIVLASTNDRVSISISHTPRVLHNHNIIGVSIALGWTGGEMDKFELRLDGTVDSCQNCFTAPGLGLNSIVSLRLDMWETVHTANVAVFGSGVMSGTFGIPNINEGFSLSATFDGMSITPHKWGS